MVREVSEDKMYDTIEFNEYLQMMSKQQKKGLTQDILKDAFRYSIYIMTVSSFKKARQFRNVQN